VRQHFAHEERLSESRAVPRVIGSVKYLLHAAFRLGSYPVAVSRDAARSGAVRTLRLIAVKELFGAPCGDFSVNFCASVAGAGHPNSRGNAQSSAHLHASMPRLFPLLCTHVVFVRWIKNRANISHLGLRIDTKVPSRTSHDTQPPICTSRFSIARTSISVQFPRVLHSHVVILGQGERVPAFKPRCWRRCERRSRVNIHREEYERAPVPGDATVQGSSWTRRGKSTLQRSKKLERFRT
jgi:hypothetical protein